MRRRCEVLAGPALLLLSALLIIVPAFALEEGEEGLSDDSPLPAFVSVQEIKDGLDNLSSILDAVSRIQEILEDSQPDYLSLSPEPEETITEAPVISADDVGVAVVDALIDYGALVPDGDDGDSILYSFRVAGEELPDEEPTEEPTVEAEEPTEEPTVEAEDPTEEPTVEAEDPTEEPTVEASEEPTAEPTVEASEEPTLQEMLSVIHTDITYLIFSVWIGVFAIIGVMVGRWFLPNRS